MKEELYGWILDMTHNSLPKLWIILEYKVLVFIIIDYSNILIFKYMPNKFERRRVWSLAIGLIDFKVPNFHQDVADS